MMDFVSKLKNLKTIPGWLSKEEIDVIFSVLDKVFEHEHYPKYGTFMLQGQYHDYTPDTIIDFEFPRGEKRHFCGQDRSSGVIASNTLYDASFYSRSNESALTHLYNTPMILRLNTTNGRFLAAFLADNGEYGLQELVYIALAKTLAMLRKEDGILQDAYGHTFFVEVEDSPGLSNLNYYLDDLFKDAQTPEIEHWKEWYKVNESDLQEFFDTEEEEDEEDEE